jgi:hypothetical protein
LLLAAVVACLPAAPELLPGQAAAAKSPVIVYVNKQYGFRFTLPQSWEGYKVLIVRSGPLLVQDSSGQAKHEEGSFVTLSIRHPLWTEKNPRQDIPIMIFTHRQ